MTKSAFSWTARDRVDWDGCILEEGLNRLEAPFVMEVAEGFAQNCKLSVAGLELPTKVDGKKIIAEATLNAPGAYAVS